LLGLLISPVTTWAEIERNPNSRSGAESALDSQGFSDDVFAETDEQPAPVAPMRVAPTDKHAISQAIIVGCQEMAYEVSALLKQADTAPPAAEDLLPETEPVRRPPASLVPQPRTNGVGDQVEKPEPPPVLAPTPERSQEEEPAPPVEEPAPPVIDNEAKVAPVEQPAPAPEPEPPSEPAAASLDTEQPEQEPAAELDAPPPVDSEEPTEPENTSVTEEPVADPEKTVEDSPEPEPELEEMLTLDDLAAARSQRETSPDPEPPMRPPLLTKPELEVAPVVEDEEPASAPNEAPKPSSVTTEDNTPQPEPAEIKRPERSTRKPAVPEYRRNRSGEVIEEPSGNRQPGTVDGLITSQGAEGDGNQADTVADESLESSQAAREAVIDDPALTTPGTDATKPEESDTPSLPAPAASLQVPELEQPATPQLPDAADSSKTSWAELAEGTTARAQLSAVVPPSSSFNRPIIALAASTGRGGAGAVSIAPVELALPSPTASMPDFSIPSHITSVSRGHAKRKQVALTFDDGPHPDYTSQLLAILEFYDVPATFFFVGVQAQKYPHWVKMSHQAGHEIASQTYDHFRLPKLPLEEKVYQIDEYQRLIEGLIGVTPRFLRPPGGQVDPETEQLVAERGMILGLWDVALNDTRDNKTASEMLATANREVRSGSVVLAHDGIQATIDMLPELIETLRARGYEFVTMSELAAGL